MEHTYRIAFRLADSSFELESSDIDWLKKKEKEYLKKLEIAVSKSREKPKVHEEKKEHPTIVRETPKADLSINEFFSQYIKKQDVKSRTTICVFFVYYLEKVQKNSEISTGDVADCFKQVSYPNWNTLNMTDILRRAKRQALLNYVNKLWSLTTSGEDFVLNTISGKEE